MLTSQHCAEKIYSNYCICRSFADSERDGVLERLVETQYQHMQFWQTISCVDLPRGHSIRVFIYKIIRFIFGTAFTVRLIEQRLSKHIVVCQKKTESSKDQRYAEALLVRQQMLSERISDERFELLRDVIPSAQRSVIEIGGVLLGIALVLENATTVARVGAFVTVAGLLGVFLWNGGTIRKEHIHTVDRLFPVAVYLLVSVFLVLPFLLLSESKDALGLLIGLIALTTIELSLYSTLLYRVRYLTVLFSTSLAVSGAALVAYLIALFLFG